jgi:transposase
MPNVLSYSSALVTVLSENPAATSGCSNNVITTLTHYNGNTKSKLAEHNYAVLWLPLCPLELRPIGLSWASVKYWISQRNITLKQWNR